MTKDTRGDVKILLILTGIDKIPLKFCSAVQKPRAAAAAGVTPSCVGASPFSDLVSVFIFGVVCRDEFMARGEKYPGYPNPSLLPPTGTYDPVASSGLHLLGTSWSPCLALYNMAKHCFPNVTLECARKTASCPRMRTFQYRRLKMTYKLKLFREVALTRRMAPVLRGMILNS